MTQNRTDPFAFLHGGGLGPDTVETVADALPDAPLLAPEGGVALRHGQTWFGRNGWAPAMPKAWPEPRPGSWRGARVGRSPGALPGCAASATEAALYRKPVFCAYGESANIVVGPAFYAAAAACLTGPTGCETTIHRYVAGHEGAPAMVDDLAVWFATVSAMLRAGDVRDPSGVRIEFAFDPRT